MPSSDQSESRAVNNDLYRSIADFLEQSGASVTEIKNDYGEVMFKVYDKDLVNGQ